MIFKFRPYGPPISAASDLRVSDLLFLENNEWNIHIIRLHLPHHEDQILQVIPSSFRPPAKLIWLADKVGAYTTKSGYKLAPLVTPNLAAHAINWNKILNEAFPIGNLLAIRGLTEHIHCKRCGEMETMNHLVLFPSKEVWLQAPLSFTDGQQAGTQNIQNIFYSGLNSADPLVPLDAMDGQELTSLKTNPSQSKTAVLAAKGWEEALQPVPNLASSPTPLIAGDNLRFPNCFVDGAWQESSLLAGMGWTLTCSATAPTIKDSSFRSKVGSALTAEALAFEKLFEAH
ncbi:LOW QUALITY PROTEIN: hypothetical protein HID58_032953 [Brassica napus]|uniref:Uncharacterized protein n=1 Tax=Brassica napus TaxID=3708 RepID=A0ABQ8BXT3_BRANA|nr:LOW QUALITY PROTEIN: hypothetical protein HID58_032953 [Brassica napus]